MTKEIKYDATTFEYTEEQRLDCTLHKVIQHKLPWTSIALPMVQDVAKTVKYDTEHDTDCNTISKWLTKNTTSYVGRKYDFGEILKIGFDDWRGIRIKFHFYSQNTIRNISVNVHTEEYWIGEPLDEKI